MASVLSLAASSPLREPHRHHVFERSGSSFGSVVSTGTVQHHPIRRLSGSSLSSLTSLWAPPFRRSDNAPSRLSSSHDLSLRRCTTSSDRRSTSSSNSRRTSFVSLLSSKLRSESALNTEQNETRLLDVAENDGEVPDGITEEVECAEPDRVDIADCPAPEPPNIEVAEYPEVDATEASLKSPRFQRWLSTLRRRKQQIQSGLTPPSQKLKLRYLNTSPMSPVKRRLQNHEHSDSRSSSAGFVTAVKSATATIASTSIATVSHGNARWRRGHQRSSLLSGSDPRPSVDSQRSAIDEAAKQRSQKRRDKLEELIRSEESYVADMKALSNVRSWHRPLLALLMSFPVGLLYDPLPSTDLCQLCEVLYSAEHQ